VRREAVVFVRTDSKRAYGCLYAVGRRVRLNVANEGYWLAGRFVAYSRNFFIGEGDELYVLSVVDLREDERRGTAIWFEEGSDDDPEEGSSRAASVTDLTLKRNGSVGSPARAFSTTCAATGASPSRYGGGTAAACASSTNRRTSRRARSRAMSRRSRGRAPGAGGPRR
jgi:hypothetical protein